MKRSCYTSFRFLLLSPHLGCNKLSTFHLLRRHSAATALLFVLPRRLHNIVDTEQHPRCLDRGLERLDLSAVVATR